MAVKKPTKKEDLCVAMHGQSADGMTHVVGIGNLRVMITNDDGSWFAQGIEIDYATEGKTLEDVKTKFAEGFYQTIQKHLHIHGSIKGLLKTAPLEVWQEFFNCASENKLIRERLAHVGIHKLAGVESIEYLARAA